jgi:hypothetical protein
MEKGRVNFSHPCCCFPLPSNPNSLCDLLWKSPLQLTRAVGGSQRTVAKVGGGWQQNHLQLAAGNNEGKSC